MRRAGLVTASLFLALSVGAFLKASTVGHRPSDPAEHDRMPNFRPAAPSPLSRGSEWSRLAPARPGPRVNVIALSPMGAMIAAGDTSGQVTIWHEKGGTILRTLDAHRGAVTGLAISDGGESIATVGRDGRVRLWSIGSGRSSPLLEVDHAEALAFANEGRTLVVGDENQVVVVDTSTLRTLRFVPRFDATISAVAVTRRGDRIAAGAADGSLRIFDADGRVLATHGGHASRILSMGWTGETLVSCGADGRTRRWSLTGPTSRFTTEGNRESLVSADGQVQAAFNDAHRTAALSDGTVLTLPADAFCSAISADGHVIAIGTATGECWMVRVRGQ